MVEDSVVAINAQISSGVGLGGMQMTNQSAGSGVIISQDGYVLTCHHVIDGAVSVTRAAARVRYPSQFMLVCAMNPCRCGYYGDPNKSCTCREGDVQKYLSRVSGPLLDRIDIQVELPAVSFEEMSGGGEKGESSATVRERVKAARAFAARPARESGEKNLYSNAAMTPAQIRRFCELDEAGKALLSAAFESMGLSGRGYDRILRVARTVADLAGSATIGAAHVAEAIQLRSLDRKYWNR
jgi:magnesium chelatase family protein